MDYEQDLTIDDSALDIEWLEQPRLMMKYIRYASQTSRDLDKAKENLDIVKAEMDLKIRSNPEKYGLEKITEAAIQNTILTSKQYQEVNQTMLDARYEAEMAKGAVRAMEQRKDALENLVRLHGQQYFAGPKVPRDLTWERQERQKKVDAGIAGKMMRRRV